jgi:arylsulfatase
LIDLYDGEIRYNDKRIGEFLDELRERDLLENSLLIFTADHGDAFYEHGYYEHPRYLHDEITHVPMLVRTPNGGSGEVDAPVSTLDVRSTVEEEVGSSDGVSLFEEISSERTVFSQARGEYENEHLWRYAARQDGEVCLCERNRETDDVEFTGEASQGLQDELEEHVKRRVRRINGEELETENEAGVEVERRLEALGYKEQG